MARRLSHRVVVLIGVAAAVLLLLAACASDDKPKAAAGLAERRATIGGLDVIATPSQLDDGGAAFTVAFDTHTGAPTIDVAANARLTVDGTTWTNPTWTGDGPGGHHRSGTLRFSAAGPARGTAELSISGLDEPVALTWRLTT